MGANFCENATRRAKFRGKPHPYNAYNIIYARSRRARPLVTSLSRPFKHSRFYFCCSRTIRENLKSLHHAKISRYMVLYLLDGYYPNDKLFGYTVDRVTQVSDFNLAAIQLHHDKTGAQHLHICQNDSNNCFRYFIEMSWYQSTSHLPLHKITQIKFQFLDP